MGYNCRRGSGGRGFISGAGETELQLQRRRFAPWYYSLKFITIPRCYILYPFFSWLSGGCNPVPDESSNPNECAHYWELWKLSAWNFRHFIVTSKQMLASSCGNISSSKTFASPYRMFDDVHLKGFTAFDLFRFPPYGVSLPMISTLNLLSSTYMNLVK